jgi:hypothetical protein
MLIKNDFSTWYWDVMRTKDLEYCAAFDEARRDFDGSQTSEHVVKDFARGVSTKM